MFDIDTRRDVLAASPIHGRDALAIVESTLRDVLDAHPELSAVRWTQLIDDPDPEVFLVSRVVVEFMSGASFDLDTATADGPCEFDAIAHSIIADLVLAQSDLLVAAFGLDVNVRVSRDAGVVVTPRAS